MYDCIVDFTMTILLQKEKRLKEKTRLIEKDLNSMRIHLKIVFN